MKKTIDSRLTSDKVPASDRSSVNNRYDSKTLFGGQQEILIEHAGHAYRLRITRQNKLILTK